MKIVYNKNPLRTRVLLDEHEKKEFWLKIKIQEMEHLLFSAHFSLTEADMFDLNRAIADVDPKYYMAENHGDKTELDKRVDSLFKHFIDDLEHNSHCGDCTCQAMSCSKCQAESLLGIDTMPGLKKHEAHTIECAFMTKSRKEEDEHTIDEAIAYLANYNPTACWEGAEAHFERWVAETKRAHEWMLDYREKHFNVNV